MADSKQEQLTLTFCDAQINKRVEWSTYLYSLTHRLAVHDVRSVHAALVVMAVIAALVGAQLELEQLLAFRHEFHFSLRFSIRFDFCPVWQWLK